MNEIKRQIKGFKQLIERKFKEVKSCVKEEFLKFNAKTRNLTNNFKKDIVKPVADNAISTIQPVIVEMKEQIESFKDVIVNWSAVKKELGKPYKYNEERA